MPKAKLLGWCPECRERSTIFEIRGVHRFEVCVNHGCYWFKQLSDLPVERSRMDETTVPNETSV